MAIEIHVWKLTGTSPLISHNPANTMQSTDDGALSAKKKVYNDVDEAKINVVYNGVDTRRFRPENRDLFRDELRSDLGLGDGEVALLLVAHNYRLKGAEIFIRVISELKARGHGGVKGVMVGSEAQDFGVYPKLAEKMGLADEVIFHEAVSNIERFYAACDIYVHPTFYDPMSLVVLEALASGLPVITTRYNGCSEIITDGVEGFSVDDPRDIAAFLEVLEPLLDASRRMEMGRAARELALEFPLERNFEAIAEVYLKAAKEPVSEISIKREE